MKKLKKLKEILAESSKLDATLLDVHKKTAETMTKVAEKHGDKADEGNVKGDHHTASKLFRHAATAHHNTLVHLYDMHRSNQERMMDILHAPYNMDTRDEDKSSLEDEKQERSSIEDDIREHAQEMHRCNKRASQHEEDSW